MFFNKHYRRRSALPLFTGLLVLWLAPRTAMAATIDVVVEGITGAARDNVLAALTIYQERGQKDLAPGRIRRLHALASNEIRTALQPYGYYRTRVDATLTRDGDHWTAKYVVELGPAIPVGTVDVALTGEGADDPAFRAVVDNFPLKRGAALDQTAYESVKKRFETIAAERGYFDMRFLRRELQIDLDAYRADVHLHIDTGPRYRFGEITIEQELLDPDLLKRYLRLNPGDPYSTAALLDAQNALSTSNFFSDVQIDADPQLAKDHVIPVQLRLKPRPQNKYTFGAGYGTDTGPRGQIGWERYYLNPEGHHTRVELRGSQIERSLTAGYFIPIRNPRTDQLAFTGGFNETDTATSFSRIRLAAVSRTTVRGNTLETLSLTHHREAFELADQTRGDITLLLPSVNWTYYLGSERIYTRFGARVGLFIQGAADKIASDTSLLQARLQGKIILPVFSFGRVIARGDVGTTSIDDFNELPASLRFYAGGDVSVRGYEYKSLGPTDAQGNVIGGRNLLVGSVEYEQHIVGNWSAAVFFDEGNAVNDFNDPLKRGAGIGVRYRLPVGQIRVDVASALSSPDHPLRLHITIGPDL